MKRRVCILWALAWALLLAACGPAESDISPQPPDPGPLTLEALSVEVSRGELSAQELARAARELPEELKAALADRGVEAETVTVSIGSSPAAMAQAVREGGVDVAFLPMADYAALEDPPQLLLTAGDGEEAMTAVVRPDEAVLSEDRFAEALAAAVNSLREEQPVFGSCDYAWAEEAAG